MTTTAVHPLADKKARQRFNRRMREKGVPAKACPRCYGVKALSQFASNGYCRSCHATRQAKRRQDPAVRERERQYQAKRRQDPAVRERERQYARHAQAQRHDTYRAKWTAPDGSIIEGDLSAPKRCTTVTNGGCGRMLTRGDFHAQRSAADGRYPLCKDCTARRQAADRLAILDALLDEGHDRCHICQGPFLEGDDWELEHIVARRNGGEDALPNWALSHPSCNASKNARDPWEVLPETLAEVGIDFHAAVRALQTYGQVVADLDEAA
ncbi:HNH endonuclease [Streptomyces sp. MD20-1-1]|uniref:HNH endonuclease signature motif containing protein n=1 Tax=Streptomyces sp. MD20-1-1 TaxID=3028668 RepID=UPI0029A496A0|nr:HNH endonuclease [Streptomyces sp. MD20-1-1]